MAFFKADGLTSGWITIVFLIKITAGIALWYIYTYHYTNRATADIYKYFDDSKILFDTLKTKPVHYFKMLLGIGNNTPEFDAYYAQMNFWSHRSNIGNFNDTHTVIRFNAFVRLFSMGFYTVHTVFMCFLSLTGLVGLYKAFHHYLPDKRKELFVAVFLLPSVLFWGSGVLKEGLLLFALGMLMYVIQKPFSLKMFLIVLAVCALMAISKFYVWIAILPGLLYLFVMRITGNAYAISKFAGTLLLLIFAAIYIEKIFPVQSPFVTLAQKQLEFNSLAEGNEIDANGKAIPPPNSKIAIPSLQPTFISFLMNAPNALFNVLFRPLPSDVSSPILLCALTENIFLWLITLLCFTHPLPAASIQWKWVLFCISFISIQSLIIGETTPILGAIVRYKVPVLPFIIIAGLFVLDKQKLYKRFSK